MAGPGPGPTAPDEFDELRQLIVGSTDLPARHAHDGTYR